MSETPERAFTIDGADYPIPTLTSFTLDEALLFHRHNGYPVERLWLEPRAGAARRAYLDRIDHPALKQTLAHVAYRRGNPDTPDTEIEEIIRRIPYSDLLIAFLAPGKDPDPVPLDETRAPRRSSGRAKSAATRRSGDGSTSGSERPAARRAPTGAGR